MTNNIKNFIPHPIGTINKNDYTQINLKSMVNKFTYLIIDHNNGTHTTTQSIGGINNKLKSMYGNEKLECSGKTYYTALGRFENLIPERIRINSDKNNVECLLVQNLKYSGLQNILKMKGVA